MLSGIEGMVAATLPVHVAGVDAADIRLSHAGVPTLRLQICAEVLLPPLVEALLNFQQILNPANNCDNLGNDSEASSLEAPATSQNATNEAFNVVSQVAQSAGVPADAGASSAFIASTTVTESIPAASGDDSPSGIEGPVFLGTSGDGTVQAMPSLCDLLPPPQVAQNGLHPQASASLPWGGGKSAPAAQELLGRIEADTLFRDVLAAELATRLGGPAYGIQAAMAAATAASAHNPSHHQGGANGQFSIASSISSKPVPPPPADKNDKTHSLERVEKTRNNKAQRTSEEQQGGTAQSETTYVITKLPPRLDRKVVLELLGKHGFTGTFDFFYAPCDFQTHKSKGYAFVNFKRAEMGMHFKDVFNNKQLQAGDQRMSVRLAEVQGFRENVVRILRTRARKNIRQASHLPLVFWGEDVHGLPLSEEYLPLALLNWLKLEQSVSGKRSSGGSDQGVGTPASNAAATSSEIKSDIGGTVEKKASFSDSQQSRVGVTKSAAMWLQEGSMLD